MTDRVHRISAGAIIVQRGRILLVRNGNDRMGEHFLVAPGGGVENDESIQQAASREVKEETGLEVMPSKVLFIEDMISRSVRIVKFWYLCKPTGGTLARTQGAIDEKIIEAGWYRKEQLKNEVVYPQILKDTDWKEFLSAGWKIKFLESKNPDADF